MPTHFPASLPTRLIALALLVLASLACNTLLPSPTPLAPASDQPPANALGHFGCVGYENGMLAEAGFLVIADDGSVQFEDFDGTLTTGQWSYAAATQTFSFTGIPLSTATLTDAAPSLAASVSPGTDLVHAETGSVTCAPAER